MNYEASMNQMIAKILLVVLTVVVFGCGKHGSDNASTAQTDLYQYQYETNGCSTGPQRYRSREAYCEALRNDAVNNYCSSQERYEAFRARCYGRSWNHRHHR